MEDISTNKQNDLVDVKEIAKTVSSAGHNSHHILRNLRTAGHSLHRIRRKNGRQGYAVTKEDAERYLHTFNNAVPEETTLSSDPRCEVEERVRQQRETEGWFSFRLSAAGMPDLINLKPKGNGLFEILFEEVKGPGDSLRKEQHATLEGLRQKGIHSTITWL